MPISICAAVSRPYSRIRVRPELFRKRICARCVSGWHDLRPEFGHESLLASWKGYDVGGALIVVCAGGTDHRGRAR